MGSKRKHLYTICIAGIVLITAIICILSRFVSTGNDELTIGSLAYKNGGTANTVYIREDGSWVPFLVLDRTDSGVFLLREETLDESMQIDSWEQPYSSYYADSDIHHYLNEEYYYLLDDTLQKAIVERNIEIISANSIGVCGTETETIAAKVFLLSYTEIGIADAYSATEGSALFYFADNVDNRICYKDGSPVSWWLRTPDTSWDTATICVSSEGEIGSGNSADCNGIRPTFVMDSTQAVAESDGIIEGETVYCIPAGLE